MNPLKIKEIKLLEKMGLNDLSRKVNELVDFVNIQPEVKCNCPPDSEGLRWHTINCENRKRWIKPYCKLKVKE